MIFSLLFVVFCFFSAVSPRISEANQLLPEEQQHHKASQWQRAAANVHYLLVDSSDKLSQNNTSDDAKNSRRLAQVLERVGPDMRPASGFEDFADVELEVAQLAWRRMHEHARLTMDERVKFAWPIVEQTLSEANVSRECLLAAQRTAQAAQQLNTWAIQRK